MRRREADHSNHSNPSNAPSPRPPSSPFALAPEHLPTPDGEGRTINTPSRTITTPRPNRRKQPLHHYLGGTSGLLLSPGADGGTTHLTDPRRQSQTTGPQTRRTAPCSRRLAPRLQLLEDRSGRIAAGSSWGCASVSAGRQVQLRARALGWIPSLQRGGILLPHLSACAPQSCWCRIPRENRGFWEWNTEVNSFAALRIRSFVTTQAELASNQTVRNFFHTHNTTHLFRPRLTTTTAIRSISHNQHSTKNRLICSRPCLGCRLRPPKRSS